MKIVECIDVRKTFPILRGYLKDRVGVLTAVDGVSLEIEKGRSLGLVGESGSGKTTLGKIILGVLAQDAGSVRLGTDKIQAIFQDPGSSLDPAMKVRDIIGEPLVISKGAGGLSGRVEEVASLVRLPKSSLDRYPHQFSGGERQRIAIGRAIITKPDLIVCDEPVSSLDVTVQLQILDLLKEIREKFAMTYLFISHDLRVIRYMCDEVAVMKEGRIVEHGRTDDIYRSPENSYTKTLLSSILKLP